MSRWPDGSLLRGPNRTPRAPARAVREATSTLSASIYYRLREAIVTLQVSPGARISEAEVCGRLGSSRTPVRAALGRLLGEGLLSVSHAGAKRRLVVSPLTTSDMIQLFLMVGALDGVTARLATQMDSDCRCALVNELRVLNTRLSDLACDDRIPDVREAEDLDVRFHRAYQRAAAAPQILLELESLGARRSRYVRVYTEALLHFRNLLDSVAEHDAIIAAMAKGDEDAAERAAVFNHRNAMERFRRALDAAGERGIWS
jgi:DNA-binding GntR family transcriptional regulator